MHLPLAATSLLLTFLTSSVAGRPSPHDAYPPETILTRRATPSPLDIMQASKIIQTFVHESPAAQAARLSSKDSLLRLVRAAMDSEARLRQQHPMAKGSANAAEAHKMNHYVLLRIQGVRKKLEAAHQQNKKAGKLQQLRMASGPEKGGMGHSKFGKQLSTIVE